MSADTTNPTSSNTNPQPMQGAQPVTPPPVPQQYSQQGSGQTYQDPNQGMQMGQQTSPQQQFIGGQTPNPAPLGGQPVQQVTPQPTPQQTQPSQQMPITNTPQPAAMNTQQPIQATPITQQQGTQNQQAPDLSKYKMEFKNVTYPQLIELAKSSVLLEPNDIPKFEQKYQAMQPGNAELDKAFNVLFEEEFEYLEEEIEEMRKLLAGELKGDQNTDKLMKVYESRLEVLKQIKAQVVR